MPWASLQCVIVVFPDHVHLHVKCEAENSSFFSYKNSKGLSEPVHLHILDLNFWVRSGSVVECMSRDRGVRASPASLLCVLERDTFILA